MHAHLDPSHASSPPPSRPTSAATRNGWTDRVWPRPPASWKACSPSRARASPYAEQWAQSERRLALITTDELDDELVSLCGEPYLPLLRQAHLAYGEALGITKRKPSPVEATRVLEPLRQLKEAITSYARGVIGTMNEDDPESVAAAEQQLEPILRARRTATSGEPTTDEPAEPVETPLPELPAAVAAAATTTAA